ncbi:MAG: sulfatase [Candidatus Solibacter sp.]|nr:sulfatase [Candidatus Solibacter sp.]
MMSAMATTRRAFLGTAAAGVLRGQGGQRPNLLFLLGDDHRWDALGCMGNRTIQTPNIDGLSRGGVTFENNFVTTAICVTSRASFFSGLYARKHGILAFNQQFSAGQFDRTYPALLGKAGYKTGFIGKYGLDGGTLPEERFDYWRGFRGQGRYFPKGEPGPHLTQVMADQAVEFIDTVKAGDPFCLSVSFKAPHVEDDDPRQFLYDPRDEGLYRDATIPLPKTADPKYISMLPLSVQRSEARKRWAVRFATPGLYQESVKSYYRLVTGVDRAVGEMLKALEARGLRENTVIVYTGDNGFYLNEHGLAGKWFMHEESIRTPLIVNDPRKAGMRGMRTRQMALNIDIAPTLLDMAGVGGGERMQGRSLIPALRGSREAWRSEFFYEHNFAHAWIPQTEGVRDSRWKYTKYVNNKPPEEELYDLQADPLEERNLAGEAAGAAELKRLRGRHAAWLKTMNEWDGTRPWVDPA